jgi:hypothetical protein
MSNWLADVLHHYLLAFWGMPIEELWDKEARRCLDFARKIKDRLTWRAHLSIMKVVWWDRQMQWRYSKATVFKLLISFSKAGRRRMGMPVRVFVWSSIYSIYLTFMVLHIQCREDDSESLSVRCHFPLNGNGMCDFQWLPTCLIDMIRMPPWNRAETGRTNESVCDFHFYIGSSRNHLIDRIITAEN